MKLKEIKDQFNELLRKELIDYIDQDQLTRNHPNYPLISNISLSPTDVALTDDHIDSLNDDETISLQFDIDGNYSKTKADKNGTMNGFFTLTVIELEIKIDNNRLTIINCNCYLTIRKW